MEEVQMIKTDEIDFFKNQEKEQEELDGIKKAQPWENEGLNHRSAEISGLHTKFPILRLVAY